jgi:hypothetical protein
MGCMADIQDCPPEALPELCGAVAIWGWVLLCISKTPVVSSPGYCCLMAAHNHSRVAHYVTALTVVVFSTKSTNHTTWRSQNITAITLQADWFNLNYLDCGDSACCQSMLAHFVSRSDSEPTSRIHWQCVRGNHDHEWHTVRGRRAHYKFFAACGLLVVLTEPITHKLVEA